MTEADLERQVRGIARDLGLLAYHTHDSRRSPGGFPDWVFAGARVAFRELKRQSQKPTPAQQAWLDRLAAAGQDAGVWRPADLLSGRVARELTVIAGLAPRGQR
jgi:hypothetical protein